MRLSLNRFIEYAPIAIALFDRDLCYLAVSQRYCADYLVSQADMIGKNLYDVYPNTPPSWKETHQRCLQGHTEKCDEYLLERSDGSREWLRWQMAPWETDSGEIGGSVLYSEVITKEVEARLAAEKESNKYLGFFNEHTAVQFLIDPANGQIVAANHAAAKYYGWPIEQLVSMNIGEINTLSQEEIAQEMQNARQYRKNYFEFRHRLADGDIRDVYVFSSPLPVGDRTLLHSIVHDVTVQKRALEALRLSEIRFRDIVEGAPIGIFIQIKQKFEYLNPYACKILGASSVAELLGIPVQEVLSPEFHEATRQRTHTLNVELKPVDGLVQPLKRVDGTVVWVEISGQPILYDGRHGGLMFIRQVDAPQDKPASGSPAK
jgi:PAS domain S-box-containing protein